RGWHRIKRIVIKFLLKAVATIGALWVFCATALFAVMWLPPGRFTSVIGRVGPVPFMIGLPFQPFWMVARKGPLSVGDAAPDFELERHDRKGRVRLASHQGLQPVVLVFGSYT